MADISKITVNNITYNIKDSVARDHIANRLNPHNVTKAQVGLGNVDNTRDADKPISTAMQTALDKKADKTLATTSANGLMSAADKTKLDGSYSLVDFVNDKIQFNSNDDYLHTYLVGGVTYVFSGDTTYKSFRDASDNNTALTIRGTKADVTYTPEKSGVYCLRWYKAASDTALATLKLTCSTVGGAHQHLAGLSKMLNTSLENLNSVATSSADGLMSKSDKAKLDGIDPSAITKWKLDEEILVSPSAS